VFGNRIDQKPTRLPRISRGTLAKSPETAEMRNSTVLYVFTVD
jgi:hypothetical protein